MSALSDKCDVEMNNYVGKKRRGAKKLKHSQQQRVFNKSANAENLSLA